MPVGQVVPVVPEQEPGAAVGSRDIPHVTVPAGPAPVPGRRCFPLPLPCNTHAGATVMEISACSAKQSAAIWSHKHAWARSQPRAVSTLTCFGVFPLLRWSLLLLGLLFAF